MDQVDEKWRRRTACISIPSLKMENLMRTRSLAAMVFVLLTGQVAMAHPGHWEHGGVVAGTLHPIFGYDHIIAALAVGFWAMRGGGKIRWMLPGAFLLSMFVA